MADEQIAHLIEGTLRVSIIIDDSDRRARVRSALEGDSFEIAGQPGGEATNEIHLVLSDGIEADGRAGEALHSALWGGSPPVIVIAASNRAGVEALEAGAADYVVEPFAPRELRVRAALRASGPALTALVCGELRIDRSARRVSVGGTAVELTRREYELLVFLAERPGRVISRGMLLESVWGASTEWQQVNTVTEHVYRLRRKIEADPRRPRWIVTVRGAGYRFDL